MDTRHKIVSAESVPAGCTAVTVYFDVLLADDMRDLAALPRPIAAVVLPLAGELLSQQARAELAAGLRVIDYVVLAGQSGADALVESLRPSQIVALETAQTRRSRQLKEHVRNRQTR
jgi:hypothetical protein